MSIRHRHWSNKDGSTGEAWVVNYTDASGKRRLKSFKRKIDAQRHETQVKVELARGSHVPARQSITVSEAADIWYRGCEGRQLRRATLEQYAGNKKKIVARLGGTKLNELTEAKVLDFRDKIATEDWKDDNGTVWPGSPQEAKMVFWTLGAILNDAKGRGLVGQNVVYNVTEAQKGKGDRRKVSQKRKLVVDIDYPTPDEVRRILAQLKDDLAQWRTLILTMAFTGMRIGEIRALPRSNVEVMKPPYQLHVRQSADAWKTIDVPKSTASDRSIDLIPTLVRALREHLLKTPKTALDLVFPNPRGEVLNEDTINTALREAQRRAGVVNARGEHKYTAHKLRHFFASWCINSRADGGLGMAHEPKRIQQWLGHANIRLTFETYGHLFPRSDASAELAAADAAFFGKPAPTPATVTALKPISETVPVEEEAAPPPMPTPVTVPISETVPVDDVPQPKPSPVVVKLPENSSHSEELNFSAPTPAPTPAPVARPKPIAATVSAFERAKAGILAHPDMSIRALVSKIGVSGPVISRARAALKNPGAVSAPVSVDGRSTLGQFLPGPRSQPRMDRAKAAVLKHPNMPAAAIAREIGVSKKTVLNAKNALNIGTRNTAEMARVEAAVLANPGMPSRALAKKLGVGKTTVLRAQRRLKSNGENPVSQVPVEGEAGPQP